MKTVNAYNYAKACASKARKAGNPTELNGFVVGEIVAGVKTGSYMISGFETIAGRQVARLVAVSSDFQKARTDSFCMGFHAFKKY